MTRHSHTFLPPCPSSYVLLLLTSALSPPFFPSSCYAIPVSSVVFIFFPYIPTLVPPYPLFVYLFSPLLSSFFPLIYYLSFSPSLSPSASLLPRYASSLYPSSSLVFLAFPNLFFSSISSHLSPTFSLLYIPQFSFVFICFSS